MCSTTIYHLFHMTTQIYQLLLQYGLQNSICVLHNIIYKSFTISIGIHHIVPK